jgi:hypothetical protein
MTSWASTNWSAGSPLNSGPKKNDPLVSFDKKPTTRLYQPAKIDYLLNRKNTG